VVACGMGTGLLAASKEKAERRRNFEDNMIYVAFLKGWTTTTLGRMFPRP
jgi:hypothetical protein